MCVLLCVCLHVYLCAREGVFRVRHTGLIEMERERERECVCVHAFVCGYLNVSVYECV